MNEMDDEKPNYKALSNSWYQLHSWVVENEEDRLQLRRLFEDGVDVMFGEHHDEHMLIHSYANMARIFYHYEREVRKYKDDPRFAEYNNEIFPE
jgi:hypothetical protein